MPRNNVKSYVLPASVEEIDGQLISLRWKSRARWAREHGHHPRTVCSVLKRWIKDKGQRQRGKPLGFGGQQILADLAKTLRERISPPE